MRAEVFPRINQMKLEHGMKTTHRYSVSSSVSRLLTLGLLAGLVCGCTSTYKARSVKTSGFLGDYSQLTAGEGDEALLRYVNPKADFKTYKKIMLDPVRVYAAKDSALAKLSKEDLQGLVNYLDATLRETLKADYTFVDKPGPDVMRLRVALTDAKGSRVIMDTISSVTPPGIALSAVKTVATGSSTAVGSASAECEGIDSVSNERLFAGVDARIGRKYTGKFDKFSKWHTAKDAFDYWALRLQTRLGEQRNKAAR
jgi:hypothetical protein